LKDVSRRNYCTHDYTTLDVLISPKRVVEHLCDLTDIETADLFNTAKKIQVMLKSLYKTDSATLSVQDGPDAGQTVKVKTLLTVQTF
jgi:diadenosine tetraphosphate (Ap4A) HIT family hydrolase